MIELLPCPFCGKTVEMLWWDSEHQNEKKWEPDDEENGIVSPFIHCWECDADIFFDLPRSTGRAVAAAWNTRATSAPAPSSE